MALIGTIPTFTAGTTARAADITTAFSVIKTEINNTALFTDVNRTVTAVITWNSAQSFVAGWSAGATCTITTGGLTVSAGGIAVTGNSTIAGTLGGLTGLTVASGGATLTSGNLTLTAGNATLTAGNLALTNGNVALADGQVSSAEYDAGDVGTAITIDWNRGNHQKARLTSGSPSVFTLTNPAEGAIYSLVIYQDPTGARGGYSFSPALTITASLPALTPTTTANKADVWVLLYRGGKYVFILGQTDFLP